MSKTILITGATDGIGLLTARHLAGEGHRVLLHGRKAAKLETARAATAGETEGYIADLSRLSDVAALGREIQDAHGRLDVLINNAGVLKTAQPRNEDGQDVRFVVNTFAPYLLTQLLLPIIPAEGRVVNVSSAAQAPVDLRAMAGEGTLAEMAAYAQSKLAITIWTREMARALPEGPVIVAVNPGSLLASKMVKEGFGIAGNDLEIGAGILVRAALDASFADASGRYFDNDAGRFGEPQAAAFDTEHAAAVMAGIEKAVAAWR